MSFNVIRLWLHGNLSLGWENCVYTTHHTKRTSFTRWSALDYRDFLSYLFSNTWVKTGNFGKVLIVLLQILLDFECALMYMEIVLNFWNRAHSIQGSPQCTLISYGALIVYKKKLHIILIVAGGQSRYQYRTWPESIVYVYIIDVNDNSPQWVIPEYPRQRDITKDKYFRAIDINTKPGREILTILVCGDSLFCRGKLAAKALIALRKIVHITSLLGSCWEYWFVVTRQPLLGGVWTSASAMSEEQWNVGIEP